MDEFNNNNMPEMNPQGAPAPAPQNIPGPAPQGMPAPAPQGMPAPAPQGGKKGMCIAALVLGIVAFVLGYIPYANIAAVICGGLGVFFGILGFKSYKEAGEANGMAVAGLVVAVIGCAAALVGFFSCTVPAISACCRYSSSVSSLLGSYY